MRIVEGFIIVLALCAVAAAQVTVPQNATAGEATSLSTSGSGSATLYLVGPGTSLKRDIKLGESVSLSADDLAYAGRYTAILNGQAQTFSVSPAKPQKL